MGGGVAEVWLAGLGEVRCGGVGQEGLRQAQAARQRLRLRHSLPHRRAAAGGLAERQQRLRAEEEGMTRTR